MNDLVAENLLLISAFALVVVMVIIIVKERRKRKAANIEKAKKHAKRKLYIESQRLYID